MNKYYVYGLMHPNTNQPFYIGKGKNERAQSHLLLKNDDIYNMRKRKLIEQLITDGQQIEIIYYDTGLTNDEANAEEKRLIRKYGRLDYDNNGILTNMTKGGEGGDNSQFFTEESYSKMSRPGIKNPRAKLTEEQVIEIYHSIDPMPQMVEKYNVGGGQINGIKKKVYYADITQNIQVLPGITASKCSRQILPYDIVKEIYLKEESYAYFKEKYNISYQVVRRIKQGKSNKTATKNLGPAGHVKKHRLTNSDIAEIRQSNLTSKQVAGKFGVHQETIRNIETGRTHRFFSYEY